MCVVDIFDLCVGLIIEDYIVEVCGMDYEDLLCKCVVNLVLKK